MGCLKVFRRNGFIKSKSGTNDIEHNVLQKKTGIISFKINTVISDRNINGNFKKVIEGDDIIQAIENKNNNDSEIHCSKKAFVSAISEQNEERNKIHERNMIKSEQMKDIANVKRPELGLSINTNFRKLLKGNIEMKSKTSLDVEKINQQNEIVESLYDSENTLQEKIEMEENKNICQTVNSSSENAVTIVIATEGHQPVQQPEEHIDKPTENNLDIDSYVTDELGSARRNDDINISDAMEEKNETTIDNESQALVKKIGDNLNKIFINCLQKSNDESIITSDDDMEIDEVSDSSGNSEYETSDSEENEDVCISNKNDETQPMKTNIEHNCKQPGKCCNNEAGRNDFFQKRKVCLHFTRKKESNKLKRRKRSVKERSELARKRDRERKSTLRRNQTMEQREMDRLKGRLRKRRLRMKKRQQEIFGEKLRRQVATWRTNCSVEENMLEFIRKYTRKKENEVSD